MIANRSEINELYTFFHLLHQGKLAEGDAKGNTREAAMPIAYIQRVEHDETRLYHVLPQDIRIKGENVDKCVPREDFGAAAETLLNALLQNNQDEVELPDALEAFLDEVNIFNLEAVTQDRTDMHICLFHDAIPPLGFKIYSRLCRMNPLLDGGRTANLKFEQTGIRFPSPTVNKINFDAPDMNVGRRMMFIESMGGQLKYADVADKVFRNNLYMIDIHFPRVLAEMTRIFHLDGTNKISELTEIMKERNPLKVKDELIQKNHYYEYKMKEFLMAITCGMRPAKIYNGREGAIQGVLMVDDKGNIRCYHKHDANTFADYLYTHTRLEAGSTEKDKYGYLERENGSFFFKLNLKIGWIKKSV